MSVNRSHVWTRRLPIACLCLLALAVSSRTEAGKVLTWRQESESDFGKGKREGVVLSDNGTLRLGRAVEPAGTLDASQVWDLARVGDVLYAATGNAGKVYQRVGDGEWTVALDAEDTQALSLVALPDGRVFAGTGPSGQVIDVNAPEHPASRPDPGVQYIWDLAADPQGNLYAATGPTGQLWKRAAKDGAWSLLWDSPRTHLLSVAVGPDGSVYCGSDGEGVLYRVDPDGKTTVVYDAPQAEVRTLLFAPDGTLYAGTAEEAGKGSSGSSNSSSSVRRLGFRVEDRGQILPAVFQKPGENERRPFQPPGGTANPAPPKAGENAVYAIGAGGAVREVFRQRVLIFALAWQEDRLMVGTGPDGILFEVRDGGRESAAIARIDHGQILAILEDGQGALMLGAGAPGGVLRLASAFETSGTLTSDVLDAKLISRFGTLDWQANRPEGTTVSLQVRTGNVGEPDATWSDWSPPQRDPGKAAAEVSPGRFAQYRVTLQTSKPDATPVLRSVTLRYQTVNLPPEVARIDVPDLSEGDGATRQTSLNLKWDARDPNDDDLAYTLHVRKEGWPDWVRLGEGPITDNDYAWDISAMPAGTYRVRVTASDRPSNPPAVAIERTLTSEPFLIDHQAPSVTITPKPKTGASVALKDDLTRLVKASYALDGGDWVPIFPEDGLFDSPTESIEIALPDLTPGVHVLVVRATDAAGNEGSGDAVFQAP